MIANEIRLKLEALLLIDDCSFSEPWRKIAMSRGFDVDVATNTLILKCRSKKEATEVAQFIVPSIHVIAFLSGSPIARVAVRWGKRSCYTLPLTGVPLNKTESFSILCRHDVAKSALRLLCKCELSADDGVLVIQCPSAEALHRIKCETYGALLDAGLPWQKFSYRFEDINHTLSSRKIAF